VRTAHRPTAAFQPTMKFSKDLNGNLVERWEQHYIKYDGMKKLLKQGPQEGVEAAFDELYNQSIQIVNEFFRTKIDEYEQVLSTYEKSEAEGNAAAETPFFKAFKEMGEFQTFIWINSTGFQKIMKKYDKRMELRGTGKERQTVMEESLLQELFMSDQLEKLLERAKKVNSTNQSSDKKYELKLLGGSANPELAEEISGRLGIPLLKTEIKRFNDGECSIKIHEKIRGTDVFIIQPTCMPVNDNLMELLLMISALKRASVHSVVAVVPYYGYARQDRKSGSRVPISAADVARMMEAMGVDRVICVDLHAGQIQGFFGPCTPVDNLVAGPIALEYYRTIGLDRPVIVSPDAGGVARVKEFKEGLSETGVVKVTMAMIIKQREAAGKVGSADLVGDVKDKDCIIVDDIIDTAGTLCAAANELKAFGAKRVFAFATHGLFNGPAPERIMASALEEVAVANTVPLQPDVAVRCPKIKMLSVGKLLAETIRRVHEGESLSEMFEVASGQATFASAPLPKPRADTIGAAAEGLGGLAINTSPRSTTPKP